jgi:hypothetical protein
VPLPVPDVPLLTVSHGTFAVAVQLHVALEAATATEPEPAMSATLWLVGASVKVHDGGGGGATAWVTVNVFPAATMVPVRALVPVLAATVNATVPSPVPDWPLVMLIHGALVVAVHVHDAADALTLIEPDPPLSATFCEPGEIENVQAGGGAAAWEMVNVLPATVIVAVRAEPLLAAMR